jgi:hypothetical protein
MEQKKHTPGPWEWKTDSGPLCTLDGRGNYRYGGSVIDLDIDEDGDMEMRVSEADRNLIAAAPDLYRELRHLVRLLEPLESSGELNVPGLATLNGARAAIEKADKP